MKKAFEQNVSRARPRLRLGGTSLEAVSPESAESEQLAAPVADALHAEVEQVEQVDEQHALEAVIDPVGMPVETTQTHPLPAEPEPLPVAAEQLGVALKARVERAKAPRLPANEAVQQALTPAPRAAAAAPAPKGGARAQVAHGAAPRAQERVMQTPVVQSPMARMVPQEAVRVAEAYEQSVAYAEELEAAYAPAEMPMEVQQPPPPEYEESVPEAMDPTARRERLKERLKAVRENPRPEPLPPTVAEAGVLAVGRISTLQGELVQLKALNLALTQDLEGARRQAEKATEEARLRMDESRRLSEEMEGRVRLLSDLERELSALEGERDEALLALQESRQSAEAQGHEREALNAEIEKRDRALAESLSEEERLAGELELAHDEMGALRRTVEALTTERDTLARQVSELTTERAELLEARKALESVHRALSSATIR